MGVASFARALVLAQTLGTIEGNVMHAGTGTPVVRAQVVLSRIAEDGHETLEIP
jgi:hypothetical protein